MHLKTETQSLEDLVSQKMNLLELITFKILKNYQKIAIVAILSLVLSLFSNPLLKSSGIVGVIASGSFLSYIHLRFGSITFAVVVLFIVFINVAYLNHLI
jgi:hypothetical protein